MNRGGCGPFVKLVVEDLNSILLTINLFIMNKKVLTLCAGLLLAGSLATLDAKITVVKNPVIGSSYVLGTAANTTNGTLNWVNNGINAVANAEVNKFGTEWTLVQAEDADGKALENQFILRSPAGTYVTAKDNGVVSLQKTKDKAVIFTLKSNMYAVVENDPAGKWTKGWYLSANSNYGLIACALSSGKPQSGYDYLQFVTFTAEDELNQNKLIETVGGNDYYFVGKTDAAGGNAKVLKYDETTGNISLEDYPTVPNYNCLLYTSPSPRDCS